MISEADLKKCGNIFKEEFNKRLNKKKNKNISIEKMDNYSFFKMFGTWPNNYGLIYRNSLSKQDVYSYSFRAYSEEIQIGATINYDKIKSESKKVSKDILRYTRECDTRLYIKEEEVYENENAIVLLDDFPIKVRNQYYPVFKTSKVVIVCMAGCVWTE